MEADGAGASGGAAFTASGFAAGSDPSSGYSLQLGTYLRHTALAVALHETGGSASLAAILPRFRELAQPKYDSMGDSEIVQRLVGMYKEIGEIARMFVFDRVAKRCTLTDVGAAHAKAVLAGDPAALRSLRVSTGGKAAAAAPESLRGAAVSLHAAVDAAKAEAAAKAKQYSRPASLGAGVAACHQCGLLTLTSGRSCCFGSPPCGASYCDECVDTCYPSLTLEALAQKCPKCSDTCICKVRPRRGALRPHAADAVALFLTGLLR